jgi:hypothetical protein
MSERSRWYFYNGRVPVPVATPDGLVVSVRPRGHVYTDAHSVRKYGDKFRPCAPPSGAAGESPAPVPDPPPAEPLGGPLSAVVTELPAVSAAPDPAAEGAPRRTRKLST